MKDIKYRVSWRLLPLNRYISKSQEEFFCDFASACERFMEFAWRKDVAWAKMADMDDEIECHYINKGGY